MNATENLSAKYVGCKKISGSKNFDQIRLSCSKLLKFKRFSLSPGEQTNCLGFDIFKDWPRINTTIAGAY